MAADEEAVSEPRGPEAAKVVGSATAPPGAKRSGRRRRPSLLAVIAVLGVAGTVAFGLLWGLGVGGGSSDPLHGTEAMQQAARTFTLTYTNFDAPRIDATYDQMKKLGCCQFSDQLDQILGTSIRSQLKAARAASQAEIRDLYVQSFDGDTGSVFVVVDQTVVNASTPQPVAGVGYVLLRMKTEGGAWKVAQLDSILSPKTTSTLQGGLGVPSSTPSTPSATSPSTPQSPATG
jgi:hypothetical protein